MCIAYLIPNIHVLGRILFRVPKVMAEPPDPSGKSLEELEGEITCIVCQSHYQEAKLLPCMHYYCRACIEELSKRSQGRPFPCPECRKDTTLPSGGAEQLQSAFFVERMKELYGKMATGTEGKTKAAACEMCSKGKAVAFCRGCAKFACTECARSHEGTGAFDQCRILMLEKESGEVTASVPNCPEHNDPMTVFCFTCDSVVCRDCIIAEHSGHTFNLLKKCASEKRRELCNSLSPLRKIHADITGADKELSATEDQVDEQEKEVCQTIQRSFGGLKAVLEQQEAELLSSAVKLAKDKKDTLAAQRVSLQTTQTEIQSVIEFVEQSLEKASDQDLMGICTQLQSKVEEEERRHQQLSLVPITTANISCSCPSPTVIPERLGSVFPCTTQGDLRTLRVTVPNTASVGILVQFTIQIPKSVGTAVQAMLRSLVDPSCVVVASLTPTDADSYTVTFTPRIRGQSELVIKVNDKEIDGSPFRMRVSANVHPTQLGAPVHILTGFNQPWGLALNSQQQLVVAECSGTVAVAGKDGKRVQTVACDRFKSPRGVATGPDGAIFVTDNVKRSGYTCLTKFDKDYRLVNAVDSGLKSPFFLKIIGNRLYVCVQGEVKVFNTNLNLIKNIPTKECPQPHDVALGSEGLYVVSHTDPGKIGVYTQQGQFKHLLDVERDLSYPRGICIDSNGFIFVTQGGSGEEGVYVFHPNGDLEASFGSAATGLLKSPAGIVVDEDGFVYVSDFLHNHIVVF